MACCAIGADGCGRKNLDEPGVGLIHGSKLPARWDVGDLRRDRFHCYLCYITPLRFPPIEPCPGHVTDQAHYGDPCRLVKGHRPPCKSAKAGRSVEEDNATRDGDPKLAAARKRPHPMHVKRHRAGPNWIPLARRV